MLIMGGGCFWHLPPFYEKEDRIVTRMQIEIQERHKNEKDTKGTQITACPFDSGSADRHRGGCNLAADIPQRSQIHCGDRGNLPAQGKADHHGHAAPQRGGYL